VQQRLFIFSTAKALYAAGELGQTRENSQNNAQWWRSRWVSFGSFVKKHHQSSGGSKNSQSIFWNKMLLLRSEEILF